MRKESGHSYKDKKAASNKVKDPKGYKCVRVCVCVYVFFKLFSIVGYYKTLGIAPHVIQ